MLFNSLAFIFCFLPATLFVYLALCRLTSPASALPRVWLVAASMFFYGWWNPVYLPLILASMTANFSLGQTLRRSQSPRFRKLLLLLGLAGNLGLLMYYKYTGFLVESVNQLSGADYFVPTIILPLGISFFTFQKIAWLVDVYRGQARESSFLDFCLFVLFFPQLIAGPIVHHGEIMPQFGQWRSPAEQTDQLATGVTIFVIGLFKKVILADSIATYAGPAFLAAEAGAVPPLLDAWGGALAYTFQLYFDFSGYSDMAIGAAWMFGIKLPINFDAPYRSESIVDFWRRWHMTLSRFLRDYLYIPLGGSRCGTTRRYANLMLTMLLGGLWHGAGWTYVIWGALHGLYLMINHAWLNLRQRFGLATEEPGLARRWLARTLTFLAVVVAWVFFRAPSVSGALNMLQGMAGVSVKLRGPLFSPEQWYWIAALSLITGFAPTTQQLLGYAESRHTSLAILSRWQWRYSGFGAFGLALVALVSLMNLAQVSEFLYFQF